MPGGVREVVIDYNFHKLQYKASAAAKSSETGRRNIQNFVQNLG